MGVRFYDSEDMFSDDDYSTSSCCCSGTTSCQRSKTNTTNNSYSGSSYLNTPPPQSKSGIYKDIVGNCKEVRIEENSCNLRIIGNNNRIRISLNMGDLIVIGNNTRLKIKTNNGHINYTGNDGRISLGIVSKQQLVDYIGCNGILKIVNSMKPNKEKCDKVNDETSDAVKNKNSKAKVEKKIINKQFIGNNTKTTTTTNANINKINNKKTKEKSHSYGGSTATTSDYNKWHQFNNLFKDKKSMPNLTTPKYSQSYCNPTLPTNIIQNIGNIVIANSSNVCITPYNRNITTQA